MTYRAWNLRAEHALTQYDSSELWLDMTGFEQQNTCMHGYILHVTWLDATTVSHLYSIL